MSLNKIKENILFGIFLMAVSQFFSASVVTAVKIVSAHLPTPFIVFVSYFICLCLIILLLLFNRKVSIKTSHFSLQISRSFFGVLYFGCLFQAVKYIPVVDGILLRTTAPIWVTFIAVFWLREKINHRIWWGIFTGFAGIALVLHPTLVGINLGYFIALFAGVSFAISSIITSQLNKLGEPLFRTLFYAFLVPSIVLSPYALIYWPNEFFFEDAILLPFIGIGTMMLLLFYVSSMHYASATVLLPITYLGVIIAGFYDWALWQHAPDTLSIAGIILVFLGCFYIVWLKNQELQQS
ncbi:DMT family transporter [Legionella nagasakiensis]|uniref:DMT family transporter n=1 Tax=Legionella nagasakiensis TaxID=535290 RepID=UPI0010546D4A|nr:DMT family transporter [Legionella nagasakiensis]